jgi:hypothetical protein
MNRRQMLVAFTATMLLVPLATLHAAEKPLDQDDFTQPLRRSSREIVLLLRTSPSAICVFPARCRWAMTSRSSQVR